MSITNSMDMSLSKLQELVIDRKAWRAAVHGITKNRTQLSNYIELNWWTLWNYIQIYIHVKKTKDSKLYNKLKRKQNYFLWKSLNE